MTEQSQLGASNDGSVMLDIGGDIGALILHTGPELLLAEIELSRVDGGPVPGPDHAHENGHGEAHQHDHGPSAAPRTHVAVRERRGPAGTRYAAIYPGLRSGEYTVWGVDGAVADTVTITGGEVAQLDWR